MGASSLGSFLLEDLNFIKKNSPLHETQIVTEAKTENISKKFSANDFKMFIVNIIKFGM